MKTFILRCLIIAIPIAIVAARFFAPSAHDHFDYEYMADSGKEVVVDRLGNVYVAGTCTNDATTDHTDLVVVKYNAALSEQWRRHYDGPISDDDVLTGLALDKAGNIFISGTSPGSGTGDDIAVKGFAPNGDDLWSGGGFDNGAKRYNSGGSNPDQAMDMCIDASNNICICGQTSSGGEISGLVIVFEPNGAIKSGWPQTFGDDNVAEYFNCIASSPDNKIVAAGFRLSEESNSYNDFLQVEYAGGGSLLASYMYDYDERDDEAVDVTFTVNGRIATAVNVHTSGNVEKFAVYHFDLNVGDGYDWVKVYGSSSHVAAIASDGISTYATGSAGVDVLTVKLFDSNGNYDTNWSGDGINLYNNEDLASYGNSITIAGRSTYITGASYDPNDDVPTNRHYLTIGYYKDGSLIFDEFYPGFEPGDDDQGNMVTVRGAGYVYVTGDYYDTVGTDYEMGSLLYVSGGSPNSPSSSTIEVGTSASGSYTDLASSNNAYQVVNADLGTTNPLISLRVEGNVGSVPSELTLQVEAKVSTPGIEQRVQLFDYDQGEYVTVDTRPATQSDQVLYIMVPGDPDVYVNGSYNVKARILYDVVGIVLGSWTASVDHVAWIAY